MKRYAVAATDVLSGQTRREILSRHNTPEFAEASAYRRDGVEAVCLDEDGDISATVAECRAADTLPGGSRAVR